ncbi:hypothetical protein Slin15195_G039570 [Septoria linicola]|uniref:Uncharacterized protein n=1 Tax=Septoria linicola TaxID=215465 RepID=A0A9Q9AR29_9PEZI|nr:hypothetical protein Slin14017_G120990 [Septoria linicola]USW50638.1 hypothetical protein Slin15195_G039570 [Septoria linicola]
MQFKFIAASLAALSVGSAIAGPLPVPAQDNSLAAREAAPVAEPKPAAAPVEARAEQAIQAAQLTQMQQTAHQWAQNHIGQVPTQIQVQNAQNWWPQQAWGQNLWGINNWNNGWNGNTWYLYYLYANYNQYAWQWNNYWPQQNWNNWGYCSPGWC